MTVNINDIISLIVHNELHKKCCLKCLWKYEIILVKRQNNKCKKYRIWESNFLLAGFNILVGLTIPRSTS